MIPFFEYMIDQVKRLLALWADDRVTEAIGANFLYIVLSIWIVIIMVNIFLIRPMQSVGFWQDAHEKAKVSAKEIASEASKRSKERSEYKSWRKSNEAEHARREASPKLGAFEGKVGPDGGFTMKDE